MLVQIERRLAPFWKGLNDHSDSWTENQLVAAVKGLPIPPADEPPADMERSLSRADNQAPSDINVNSLTVPIGGRSQSYQSDRSGPLSSARPSSSFPNHSSSATNLFRGRAKTLASLGTSKNASSSPAPTEVQLPNDPYVNGSPIEAHLYKDASECPICFLYYPPYLNRTRCCDQPICSECFVQIKRPDPHPPEHHDDPGNPTPPPPPEEEGLLVSEPSACPFCVTPEFGVTYEPPSFRRGLVFAGPASRNPLSSPNSAMASSTSLHAPPIQGRRRTTSLSASASQVITTDRVRPDWAKKLADARAHALRRSAAATALHNAAYMLGNNQPSDTRGFTIGRRRRNLFNDSPSGSGSGTPARLPDTHPLSHLSSIILQDDGQENDPDQVSDRPTSRRSRVQDLEDLMMMEAIRMSLASEEDRKNKELKEVKKEAKKKAKEDKKAEKSAKKSGGLYSASMNGSSTTWASMTRSTSNLAQSSTSPPPPPSSGKGKAPVSANTSSSLNPPNEPSSTPSQATDFSNNQLQSGSAGDPQRHLETQRANLQQPLLPSQPISFPSDHRTHLRHLSNASSAASSILDSAPSSHRPSANASGVNLYNGDTETPPDHLQSGTPGNSGPGLEPMFNFRSLAAMIGDEEKAREAEHTEYVEHLTPEERSERNESIASSSRAVPTQAIESGRSRGDSLESSAGATPADTETKAGAQEVFSTPNTFPLTHGDSFISTSTHGQFAH